ncbi:MAG: hypothetical protein QF681_12670 [Vicinamibacterales bacterium]|jgi:hypothetical protein|nr:hypothetical protein [Vicinamibacterales bacterium]
MSKEWLKDRERALENEYFRRKDAELIARLREQGRLEQERRALRDQLGSVDERLPAELQQAGLTDEGLALLHLVPLVDVAWADKGVTARERDLVLALAARRGVAVDTPEHERLEGWLKRRPDQQVFETAYEAIRTLLEHQETSARNTSRLELVAWTTRVAEATGGILGMLPISREERECLDRIAELITTEPGDAGVTAPDRTEGTGPS